MATIQVILQQDLKNLGKSGELVRVRPGYARNYLIPRSLAMPATLHNVKQIEHQQRISAAAAAKSRTEATTLAEKISAVTVTITRKVGEEDRLFGSVTTKDIATSLKEKGFDIDRKRIELAEPIRTAGTFSVTAKLLGDVTATFKVEVAPKK
ncbi:MAG TPA: 50S ribosomal protein L9 [Polyangiaceae bacterium]|jgi:large subunit ribosomal protein L9|nr:50S ribosomal protein L9 [Polyangiaceae bacterium]